MMGRGRRRAVRVDRLRSPALAASLAPSQGILPDVEQLEAETPALRPMVRGELVYLRPPERSDLPAFVRWLNDAETNRFLAMRAPLSLPLEERWFEQVLERHGKEDWFFVICLLADGRAIGNIGLHQVQAGDGHATLGIAIGEKGEWSRGFGTDALNALLDFAFGELRLERVQLDVYAGNERAVRAYEKAGFRMEGTLRRAHFKHGEALDVHRMAILREEWQALSRRRNWDFD
jgi:RimJ/RimL family protein N-acetyltransferase